MTLTNIIQRSETCGTVIITYIDCENIQFILCLLHVSVKQFSIHLSRIPLNAFISIGW